MANKPVSPVTAKPQLVKSLVDELGSLDSQAEALIPSEVWKQYEIIEKKRKLKQTELLEAAKPKADAETILEGVSYSAVVSPAANERTITAPMPQVQKAVDLQNGKGTFLNFCSITLTNLDKLLPVEIREKLIKQERTGRRSVTTAAKAVQEHMKAA